MDRIEISVLLMDPQSPPPPPINESVLDVCAITKEMNPGTSETVQKEEIERLTVQAMPLPKEFITQDFRDNVTSSDVRAGKSRVW
jgi:hypothetical protein